MKAVLCKSYGPPENLVLEEIDAPTPGKGQVLVDIYSTGLNFPDTLQIQRQVPVPAAVSVYTVVRGCRQGGRSR